MQTLITFFKDEKGNNSLMRVIIFIFAVDAIIASNFILYHDPNNFAGAISVFTSIAGTALAGKLIQKPMEKNEEKK